MKSKVIALTVLEKEVRLTAIYSKTSAAFLTPIAFFADAMKNFSMLRRKSSGVQHSYVQTVENASERKTYSSVGLSGGVFAVQENCASVWQFSCTWQSSTIVAANSNTSLVNQNEIQQDLIEQTTEFRTTEEGKTDVLTDALEVVAEQSITSVELEQVIHNVT